MAGPTINPSLVPTIAPGSVFSRFTTDTDLNVRWVTAQDPVYADVVNRPIADVALRQLILAKAVDALEINLGRQARFPFLTAARVGSGTSEVEVPTGWIWDVSMSLPKKWQRARLAKLYRMSGTNGETSGYSGTIRAVFTASTASDANETALLYADYVIGSTLAYQTVRMTTVTDVVDQDAISTAEADTICGFITFRTLDIESVSVVDFYDLLAPPTDTTDADSDGYFDTPALYEVVDSVSGGINVTEDWNLTAVSHGTGLLTDGAVNPLPAADSDPQAWLNAFNFPFDVEANRTSSVHAIIIPKGLFREFDISVPAGDAPADDTTGLTFPVWVSKLQYISATSTIRWYFSTYNVTDDATGGSPSTEPVEFCYMDVLASNQPGDIISIIPSDNLELESGTNAAIWGQHFGRGHAVLSSVWENVDDVITDFFTDMGGIAENPQVTEFSQSSTRIGSFGLSRVPKYVPTIGQSQALRGSGSRQTAGTDPSDDNRYVTEDDQGLGDRVDLDATYTPHVAISRYGYKGTLCHKLIRLDLDGKKTGSDTTYYDTYVLPRLTALLGRAPVFGDVWFNGQRFMTYSGDAWVG